MICGVICTFTLSVWENKAGKSLDLKSSRLADSRMRSCFKKKRNKEYII